jgi:hypothetical protein
MPQRFSLWQINPEDEQDSTPHGQFDTLKEAYDCAESLRLPAWDIVRAGAVVATNRTDPND